MRRPACHVFAIVPPPEESENSDDDSKKGGIRSSLIPPCQTSQIVLTANTVKLGVDPTREAIPMGWLPIPQGLTCQHYTLSSPTCAPENTRLPFWASMRISSFGPNLPSRISFDSGFSICCWIARFNGRAPYTGS